MKCPKYVALDWKGRINWLNKSTRCQWCLCMKHTIHQCPPTNTCFICGGGNHHTSICEQRWEWKKTPPTNSSGNQTMPKTYSAVVTTTTPTTNNISNVNFVQEEITITLLPPKHVRFGIAAVVITNPKNGTTAQVYAFHDSGSTMSLLRHSLADRLGLTTTKYIQKCKEFLTSKDLQMEIYLCSRTC